MKITDTFTRTYSASGNIVTLTYSVFFREKDGQYGITVLKNASDDIETEAISSIAKSHSDVLEIAHALYKGLVTPITARDIIYDILCDKYSI